MIQVLNQIGVWLGTGPLAPVAIFLGILTTIAALVIVVLELSGRTISGRRIVRSNFRWDWTSVFVLSVTSAFVVLINPVRLDFIEILNQGPRLSPALAPVIAVIFGWPGALGYMLGVLITNLQAGITSQSLFTGVWIALGFVWVTWLPYKAMGKLNFSSAKGALGTIGRFYLWAVIVGPLLHLWASPVRQVLMGGEAAAVWGRMVPMILINHDMPYLVVGPIALAILYPLAKLGGLYWRDREEATAVPA